jgi:hypothetical protein
MATPCLSREDLKQVIESPAKLFGKQVSTRLTSRLLNAMNRVKDELPLLQHALMRMWEYELKSDQSGVLDLADYDGIGRLNKALSQHANEALETMNSQERQLAATIFKTLTTVDANGRKIRRPSTMSELVQLSGEHEKKIRQVIDKFIEDRRSFIIIGNEKDPVIDISHESLIRQWRQLERWADQEAEAAENYLKLSDFYLSWKDEKKDLLSGRELELAMEWYNSFKPDKNWASRYNDLYHDCEQYLLDSQESADVVAREQAQKDARLRNLKRTLVTALIVLGPITAFFVGREVAQKMGIEIDWNNYDTLWEGARSIDNVQAYVFFLQENPDAPENLLQAATDSIRSKELVIDERNWNKADSINSLPAYQQYLDLAGAYVFPEAEGLHIEDANQVIQRLADATNTDFKKEELAWETYELSDGTFSDYLDYLISLDEITEPAVIQDSTVQVHRQFILDRIESDKREGWLFSGRLNEDKTMVVKDATFDVVWRRQTVDDPRLLPEVGDYVKSLLVRSTYKNKIDGGGVFERNDGEPIRQGEKAIISEVAVEGNVVYYKIEY